MPIFDPEELSRWTGGQWLSRPAKVIQGVSTDTRQDLNGRLYVALRGDRFDGHDFLGQAWRGGASAAVVDSKDAQVAADLPLLVVTDTLAALGQIAAGHRSRMPARMVAVTGSAGKTSVKEMLADILQRAGKTVRTQGNWNNHIGLPLSLLASETDAAYGVFELGMNHPGELAPLCRILRHDVGIVTNVAAAHIEFFASVEAIAEEKSEVLKTVPPSGLSIFCQDETYAPALRAAARGRTVTVALSGDADYTLVERGAGGFRLRERATGEECDIQTSLPGQYVIRNALLAVAAARGLGIGWDLITAAIAAYRPIGLRWQEVERGGVHLVNDAYNANPASMRAAIQAFAEMPVRGRRWLALGGMRELGRAAPDEHRDLGQFIARMSFDGLAGVGSLGCLLVESARFSGFRGESACCADAAAAAGVLRVWAEPGDAVLIKGSRGERMEEIVKCWSAAVAMAAGREPGAERN